MQANLFNPQNFEHLSHAVSLIPDLEFATFVTCYAEGKVDFPINSFEGLTPLFQHPGDLPEKIAIRKLTYSSAQNFLHPDWFPISDPDDLLRKVFLGAVRGSIYHYENNH